MSELNIRLPGCYPITVICSLSHWRPDGTRHGPESRPALMAVRVVALGERCSNRIFGRRLWVYFRGGYAFHADIYRWDRGGPDR